MHPEQAPGPDDAPKPATGGTPNNAGDDIISASGRAGDQRGELPRDQHREPARDRHDSPARDEPADIAPRDPEENPALHTASNITPADHAMVESIGGAAPPGTHPAPEAAPADAAVSWAAM